MVLKEHLELVFRLGGLGIVLKTAEHVADVGLGVDLAQLDNGLGGSHELVVSDLELLGPAAGIGVGSVFLLIPDHAAAGARVGVDVVDLVEGHPILDLALVAAEKRLGIALKGVDHVTARKPVVLLCQVKRHVKVVEGNHGLDTVLMALVKDLVVEGQALLVG